MGWTDSVRSRLASKFPVKNRDGFFLCVAIRHRPVEAPSHIFFDGGRRDILECLRNRQMLSLRFTGAEGQIRETKGHEKMSDKAYLGGSGHRT